MVFEQLFKVKFLERKPWYAFLLGFLYSSLGIISAKLIFPADIGLMSIAFTSILLIPSLNRLIQNEEKIIIREKKFSLHLLLNDYKGIFLIYTFFFFGVFFSFFEMSLIFSNGWITNLFAPQLNAAGLTGFAFNQTYFTSILLNNLLVFIVCFILSLVYGAGSILFITWNASVWGTIFGFVTKHIWIEGINPLTYISTELLPMIPHLLAESTAYISAAIVGGILSKAALQEKLFSKKFNHILTDALILSIFSIILIVFGAYLETIL